ncbi:MAG: hypothetical protein GY756_06660 [bacterium]|nr:hypothetical protein [bacterium]
MSLKEKIENNLTLCILGFILAGFLAGIGAYDTILRIAKLEVVAKSELNQLKKETKEIKNRYEQLKKKCNSEINLKSNTHNESKKQTELSLKTDDSVAHINQGVVSDNTATDAYKEEIDIHDKNALYTIGIGTDLKLLSDIYIPANTDIVYIQDGKVRKKNNIDNSNYHCRIILKEASKQIIVLRLGKILKIKRSNEYGDEDRELRHTYVKLRVTDDSIEAIKCLGKNNSDYISIGKFREITNGLFRISIPEPKEL